MLRFDRYYCERSTTHAIDLATGRPVRIARHRHARTEVPLFTRRGDHTLIDIERDGDGRAEVWEPDCPRIPPTIERGCRDFEELLACARHGAPRAFDLSTAAADRGGRIRVLARQARCHGWIPLDVSVLAAGESARHTTLHDRLSDRSLVVFVSVDALTVEGVLALMRLARRDARPHVLVRERRADTARNHRRRCLPAVHESLVSFDSTDGAALSANAAHEARARWAWLLADTLGDRRTRARAIELADVLVARAQPFEARALLGPIQDLEPDLTASGRAVLARIRDGRARTAAATLCPSADPDAEEEIEMVDDFVAVLRICQDVEDEQTALARVGALLRDRLQAASVAFVTREGDAPRVITRVGSDLAAPGLAVRSIETGLPISPSRDRGPVECAWPVRHATEVIGAVWCRWSAGTEIATEHASTLLGIAATATAPSVRLAIARAMPTGAAGNPVPELVGGSTAMCAVREAIVRAAGSPFAVLIEGESGSGKELAARAIHARSPRRDRRFCAINCAALVDELVEAELFGHVRGAFTSASSDRTGVFEEASGGTLLLDEVAELSARVQAKLLRTLQEGEVRRLGENLVRKIDARIVAATNRPLASAVAAGVFRADLWYRLDVIRIVMPPLRERLDDLPELVAHMWQTLAARAGSRAALSKSVNPALAAYDWPGNIRELQNVLASMLVSSARDRVVGAAALPAHIARAASVERTTTLADARRRFDERYVRAALAKAGGQTTAAARELGLSRQGLMKLMDRLGIVAPRTVGQGSADRPHVQ